MNGERIFVGQPVEFDQIDRVFFKNIGPCNGDTVCFYGKIICAGQFVAAAEMSDQPVEHGPGLGLFFFHRGADNIGQVSHILGDEKIMLHKAFDAGQARMGFIAQLFGNDALQVKAQTLFSALGGEMQVAAHPP